jgi:thiamine transport system ATP-binding protein
MTLSIRDATVRYGTTVALEGVTLDVKDGERLSVLGPSGSGKSTLLRAIAGLEPLAAGRIEWDGADVSATPVHRRGFGLMFQDYVLFPHLDVERNVSFGLAMHDVPETKAKDRVREMLELVGLQGYERRMPAELSGGEQQRVALARALAATPRLLMLDEPLGALDRALRRELLSELSGIFTALLLPILYVTHDHEEALAIGDRVAVMRAGRIEAVMPPDRLWHTPPNEFVARFIGLTNIVDGEVRGGVATTPVGAFEVADDVPEGDHRLLIRPDSFHPSADGPINVRVVARTFRGDYTELQLAPDIGSDAPSPTLEAHADWTPAPGIGDRIRLRVDRDGIIVLPSVGRQSG